jgi:hypothetical protein
MEQPDFRLQTTGNLQGVTAGKYRTIGIINWHQYLFKGLIG